MVYFLEAVVAFPLVTGGDERQALAEIADRLCAEFGYPIAGDDPGDLALGEEERADGMFARNLGEEDERLVAAARLSLTRLAAALRAAHRRQMPDTAYHALLNGAEVMMRNELVGGKPISTLMPSFVFLISLPLVEQDEALELSRRTAALLR